MRLVIAGSSCGILGPDIFRLAIARRVLQHHRHITHALLLFTTGVTCGQFQEAMVSWFLERQQMNILSHSGPFALFFAFAIAHALADFPLQGDYLARMKRRDQAGTFSEWVVSLSAHSLIQAGGVWIVSGSALLGATEFCLHWLIDLGKGEGKFGYATDQLLHLACKLAYVVVLVYGMQPV